MKKWLSLIIIAQKKKTKMMIFQDYRCEGKSKDDDDKEELVVLGQKGKWGLAAPVSVGGAASSTALLFFGMPPCNKNI